MQSPTQSGYSTMLASGNTSAEFRHRADVVYQAMTIAAILLILGSLWAF